MNFQFKNFQKYIFPVILVYVFFALAGNSQAATYFVDATNGNDSWTGTAGAFQSGSTGPWKTIGKVNSFNFQPGDDVYFKCGEKWNLTGSDRNLMIDWSGTGESNRATIGAYHISAGTEVLAVSGAKPVFDSDYYWTPAGTGACIYANGQIAGSCYWGGIEVDNGRSYITIQDIRVTDVKGSGIYISQSPHVTVQRCETDYTYMDGLMFNGVSDSVGTTGCSYAQAIDNWVNRAVAVAPEMPNGGWPGCLSVAHRSDHVLIKGNTVSNSLGGESIIVNYNCYYPTIENNLVYGIPRVGIYVAGNVRNATIRRNVIYGGIDSTYWGWLNDGSQWFKWPGQGISMDDENISQSYCCAGFSCGNPACRSQDNAVYDNLIAHVSIGFFFDYTWPQSSYGKLEIYNNTIIAARMAFSSPDGVYDDLIVRNNLISCAGETPCVNYSGQADIGGTWNNNLWPVSTASPYAGSGDVINANAGLSKISGWRNISAGSLTANDFKLQSASPAINKGAALGSPYNTDYFGTTRPQGAGWDIGAHEYTAGSIDTTAPSSPMGLVVR